MQARGNYTMQQTDSLLTSTQTGQAFAGLTVRQRAVWCLGLLCVFAIWRMGAAGVHGFRLAEATPSPSEVGSAGGPAERVFFGRRLEPAEPVVFTGGGPVGEASFAAYGRALSPNRPLLTANFVDLHDDLPRFFGRLQSDLDAAEQPGDPQRLIPQIALSLDAGAVGPSAIAPIGRGEEDAKLKRLVAGLGSLHRPVFLRIGYAFNEADSRYEPAEYVAAYRRIAGQIRAARLDQVALVWDWSPDAELSLEDQGARERDAAERWQAFYPGDDVVDWWGLSLMSEPAITSAVTAQFLAEAERHRYPVMVGEATPRGHDAGEGPLVLDAWYRPFFHLVQHSSVVKAFCYFDRDWRAYPQWSTWGDGRVEADPAVLQYNRAELSGPLYRGLRSTASNEASVHLR